MAYHCSTYINEGWADFSGIGLDEMGKLIKTFTVWYSGSALWQR
jgi:hypothetical protein